MAGWRGDRPGFSAAAYDDRWRQLEAQGHSPHGEADRVMGYRPGSVLDAGCGTGRVAIELYRRGVDIVGVDVDADMLAVARAKGPTIEWHLADLASFQIERTFSLAVMAGNVIVFVSAPDRALAVRQVASALEPAGLLVAGFQRSIAGRTLLLADYDAMCADAGLELVERTATWGGDPYSGGDYAVSVHRRR